VQTQPFVVSTARARPRSRLIKGAKLIVYPGAPHGLTETHTDRVNEDLLNFIKG
jgi:non-heme chloroperoxidase